MTDQTSHETAGPFLLRFICCGRDDGTCIRSSWAEADALRESYISAEGHERSCIIEAALSGSHTPPPPGAPS